MNYTRLLPWLVLGLIRTVPLAEACALRRGRRRLTARRTTTDLSPAGSLDTSDLYDLALHPPSIIEAHFQEIDGGMQLFRHVKHANNNNNNNNNNNQANALWYGVTDKGDEIFLMPYRDAQGNARYVGTAHVGPTVYDMHVDRTGKQMVTPMQVSAMDEESVDVNGDEITFHRRHQHRLDNTVNHSRRLAVPNVELVTLRLIVAWTKRAECLNARLSGDCDSLNPITWQLMKAHADLAVEMTNEAFRQSGVLIRLQTVYHTRVANYTEPDEGGFQNASNALMNPDDGIMDDLHEQRGIHRAHIVALLKESRGGECIQNTRLQKKSSLRTKLLILVTSLSTQHAEARHLGLTKIPCFPLFDRAVPPRCFRLCTKLVVCLDATTIGVRTMPVTVPTTILDTKATNSEPSWPRNANPTSVMATFRQEVANAWLVFRVPVLCIMEKRWATMRMIMCEDSMKSGSMFVTTISVVRRPTQQRRPWWHRQRLRYNLRQLQLHRILVIHPCFHQPRQPISKRSKFSSFSSWPLWVHWWQFANCARHWAQRTAPKSRRLIFQASSNFSSVSCIISMISLSGSVFVGVTTKATPDFCRVAVGRVAV